MSESRFYKDTKEQNALECLIPTRASYHVLVSAHVQIVESAFRQQEGVFVRYFSYFTTTPPSLHHHSFVEMIFYTLTK